MNKKSLSIPNPKELKKKIAKFKTDGLANFHIVADFDRTLTKGKKTHSSYEFVRKGKYLTPDYAPRSYALFYEYYPLEISESLPLEEKKVKMDEWWTKHYDLMIECGMNADVVKDIIKKGKIQLRKGASEFLDILAKNKIPILIFSAGIGNFIKEFLISIEKLTKNIHIISNFLKFDKKGIAKSYTKPLIHTFNKNEIQVKNHPYQNEIIKRKNVILLGDLLGDLGMTEGIKHDTIIRIGFLNHHVKKFLNEYNKNFDVVVLNDGPMDYVNKLVKDIL